MSVKADPTTAAAAWVSGMQGATAKYTAGVNAVKVAPGQAAAANASLWAANVAAAVNKFASNSAKVTLQSWQQSAINKGAPRLGTGATAAQPKFQAFMTAFIPQLTNIVNALPPRGTFDQNISRFTQFAQALHAAKGSF